MGIEVTPLQRIQQTERLIAQLSPALETASIAFVTMAEHELIDEVTATENISVFAVWQAQVDYKVGNLRQHKNVLYRCIQAHTSKADWTPDVAVSLWVKAGDPAEEWPQWSQPVGAHDAYAKGAKVADEGERWVSDLDGNVWKPGVYGWTKQ